MDRSTDVRPAHFRASTELSSSERRADLLCLWGRRGPYARVPVGLYAVGGADEDSPVLLTSNYRLSFDTLRTSLRDCSCWILVIDTAGLDVGSAAAAGRFATADIERGVKAARLDGLVRHRTLILPGRAASAVEPELLAVHAGFTVAVGPMRSRDISAFLAANGALSSAMTEEPFPVDERLAAIPRHLARSLQWWVAFAFVAILYAGLGPEGVNLSRALAGCPPFLLLGLGSVIAGSVIAPLLPRVSILRPFSLRGILAGIATTAMLLEAAGLARAMDVPLRAACWLFFPTASGLLSFLFAAAEPLRAGTRRSGEKRFMIPFVIVAFALAAAGFFAAWRMAWSPA